MGIQTGGASDTGFMEPAWDDLRFPLVSSSRLDTSSGRIDYDFFNAAVEFQSNARYPNEPVCFLIQMQHTWKEETEIRPHLHWVQQGSDVPNWLMAWKYWDNGQSFTLNTDYSAHTLAAWDSNIFTYTSGSIVQISEFPAISMAGMGTSDGIVVSFFRDSANTSGQFAGADPSAITESAFEFDIHFQKDFHGSRQEFAK